jgi:hypothetical protein
MKKKIIIGIHGIGNKPPKRVLKKWWKKSIREGLKKIGHPRKFFKFELVYWAHYLHSKPLNPRIKDKDSPFYVEYPYAPADLNHVEYTPSWLRKKSLDILEKILDKIFLQEHRLINFDKISDFIIRSKFKDLNIYYDQDDATRKTGLSAKEAIRQELAATLRKHKDKRILLIAHSMGSIIAYYVLTQEVPDVNIHTFLTIGSPLGLPAIMKKILAEQKIDLKKEKKIPTPRNIVKSWYNFSDLNDSVTLNYSLADDYKENSHHVSPKDVIVCNDYEYQGSKNPHKSYGYLRAPEVAEVIHQFLEGERPKPLVSLTKSLEELMKNITKAT